MSTRPARVPAARTRRSTRRLALLAHVITSVGWLGVVLAFAVLAALALTSESEATIRSALLVMEPLALVLLLPLAALTLLTGIVQGLSTRWGLFGHYWVLFKLLVAVASTVILFAYMSTFAEVSASAADPAVARADLRVLAASVLLHSLIALAALLFATGLSVFKPKGELRVHSVKRNIHLRDRTS